MSGFGVRGVRAGGVPPEQHEAPSRVGDPRPGPGGWQGYGVNWLDLSSAAADRSPQVRWCSRPSSGPLPVSLCPGLCPVAKGFSIQSVTLLVATGVSGPMRLVYGLLGATLDAGCFPSCLRGVGQLPPNPWRWTVTLGLPNPASTSLDTARACCTSWKC